MLYADVTNAHYHMGGHPFPQIWENQRAVQLIAELMSVKISCGNYSNLLILICRHNAACC